MEKTGCIILKWATRKSGVLNRPGKFIVYFINSILFQAFSTLQIQQIYCVFYFIHTILFQAFSTLQIQQIY